VISCMVEVSGARVRGRLLSEGASRC